MRSIQQAALAINPADPQGEYSPFVNSGVIVCYIDIPSLVLVIGGWWVFRLASGKRRELIAAPVVILIGVIGSILGFCLMLADLDPNTIGAGFMVSSLTTLYGFIAAAGFLIADMRRSFRDPPPQPPVEGMEEAKRIIDNVVAGEQR